VQSHIELFTKLHIELYIQDSKEVLIVKINSGLLLFIHREVYLFERSSLDTTFLRALVVEWKLTPCLRAPLSKVGPSSSPSSSASPISPKTRKWCSYHKSQFHSSLEYHVLHNHNHVKTLFVDSPESSSSTMPPLELIPLENPTELNHFLMLMAIDSQNYSPTPFFTHNFLITQSMATLILGNGIQNNLVS